MRDDPPGHPAMPAHGPSPSRRAILAGGFALAAGALVRPAGAAASSSGVAPTVEQVREMQAGSYVWLPELAPEGPVLLVVSLSAQRAVVYRNGVPIGVSTVSTGKPGHETPTGVFTVLQKRVDHKSNLYNDAPMPFMQRLTWDGIALHAGNLPGYPASHGCVRLPMKFARALYAVTRLGMTVLIAGDQAVPRVGPGPAFLADESARRAQSQAERDWNPAASPSGPVSIVVSAADRRIVVLRNGVRIGSAPVSIAGQVDGVAVFTLGGIDGGDFHWLQIGLGGDTARHPVSEQERARLKLPGAFQDALRAILSPGTTAIVTPDSLDAAPLEASRVVVESEEAQ